MQCLSYYNLFKYIEEVYTVYTEKWLYALMTYNLDQGRHVHI